MKAILCSLALSLLLPAALHAELALPHFFSDHMVLQRDRDAAIWGTSEPGAEVTVAFQGKTASARAGDDGKWQAAIPTGEANATGAELTVSSGEQEIVIRDVLVGEVWFASGQSNMYFTMDRVPAYVELIAESNHPGLRMFNAPHATAVEPQDDIEGEWTAATPETVPGYSAVAFFFARKLHLELGIPVGVIKSAWGGKPVETFTSREALSTHPASKLLVDTVLEEDGRYDQAKADAAYEAKLAQWTAGLKAYQEKPKDTRGRYPKKPQPPKRPLDTEGKPGVLFDAMIHPFVGYTMRGAIWYQGEGNAKPGAVPYDESLPLMIGDWRTRWQDDFSFYFVQLANFRDPSTEPGNDDPWPLLQDRMRRVLATTPKTGMAITNDIGEAKDIHPKNKKDVGERLALWALAKDYGRDDLVYSGPLFSSHEKADGAIRVTFDHVGEGLEVRGGGELERFEIAGEDKTWHWAEAKIEGKDTVVVSSSEVADPVAVRYAWAANPEGANLVNSEGLPASVFRTDDWDDVEPKVDTEALKLAEDRRALGVEIRVIRDRRDALEKTDPQYKELNAKFQEMMKEFRAMTEKVKEPAK